MGIPVSRPLNTYPCPEERCWKYLGILVVPWHPHFLADQLTLSQPRGGRLCTPSNTGTPGFSNLPTALFCTVLLGVSLVGGLGYRGLASFAYRLTIICMISALSLQGQNSHLKVSYIQNEWILSYLLRTKIWNIFGWHFGEVMTSWIHSEFNWPLWISVQGCPIDIVDWRSCTLAYFKVIK